MVYVKYIAVAFLLITAALVVFRIVVKKGYQKKGKLTPITILLQLLIFFLHAISSYIYIDTGELQINKDSLLEIIGNIFMIIGVAFILLIMINLGIKKTFGGKAEGLKQTGFYKYSRNPQIVFYILFLFGYAFIYPSWTGLIWIGTFLVICHIMIITEEEHLLRVFDEEYNSYCKKTPRYIGFRSFLETN
jgi:protein-S-isoprenylcysteine O-methyltransferase Ste14